MCNVANTRWQITGDEGQMRTNVWQLFVGYPNWVDIQWRQHQQRLTMSNLNAIWGNVNCVMQLQHVFFPKRAVAWCCCFMLFINFIGRLWVSDCPWLPHW
jgi:hypothetical protein